MFTRISGLSFGLFNQPCELNDGAIPALDCASAWLFAVSNWWTCPRCCPLIMCFNVCTSNSSMICVYACLRRTFMLATFITLHMIGSVSARGEKSLLLCAVCLYHTCRESSSEIRQRACPVTKVWRSWQFHYHAILRCSF